MSQHKRRKQHPSLPVKEYIYYGLLDDNCWDCKDHNSCHNCYKARKYMAEENRKQTKQNRKPVRFSDEY